MRALHQLWILSVTVPAQYASFFSDALEADALALSTFSPPRQSDATIEAIYGVAPDQTEITLKLAILAEMTGIKAPIFALKLAPELDWLKKVAEDFPPIKIGRWVIHGAMHRRKVSNRLHALQIDATSAFGTGEHPTTRGCLLMLDKILKKGFEPRSLADIGCGSGILSMAFIKAVRGQAVAVDLDPDSVQIAQNNVRDNGLISIKVGKSRGYAAPLVKAHAPYDLIMSNIFAGPLCQMAHELKEKLRPGGMAILSGLLRSQAKKVIAAHRMQGLILVDQMHLGEWSVLAIKRVSRA